MKMQKIILSVMLAVALPVFAQNGSPVLEFSGEITGSYTLGLMATDQLVAGGGGSCRNL